mmetsp:Transcript_11858/g.31536  ORF Transcript_11858/g.31536 Transcript_11858/m.31536 type:complete len:273 (-) Transcript_11858:532-1350(-)
MVIRLITSHSKRSERTSRHRYCACAPSGLNVRRGMALAERIIVETHSRCPSESRAEPCSCSLILVKLSTTTPTKRLEMKSAPTKIHRMKYAAAQREASRRGASLTAYESMPWYMTSGQRSSIDISNRVRMAMKTLSKLPVSGLDQRRAMITLVPSGCSSAKAPVQLSRWPMVGSLHSAKRPMKSCTPRMPKMRRKSISMSSTWITPGSARSSELTTSFMPGLREIIRRGRSARSERSDLTAGKAEEPPEPAKRETRETRTTPKSSWFQPLAR